MYEQAGPAAFGVLNSLLVSEKDEVRFHAAREILNKLVPDKFNDNYAFLVNKSEEELIALIIGTGVLKRLDAPRKVIDITPEQARSSSQNEPASQGLLPI